MSKLVLIDGNAILHRAYHALPKTLTNKKGELTNAVYGFTSMLLRIIEDLKPTHLAVCFDRKEPTFRKKMDKHYQAHRPKMDDELSGQFPKVRELAQAMGIPVYDKAGYEADDLIGTIASKVTKETRKRGKEERVDEVVIITGDRDILQLVTDEVKVYLPVKGLSEAELLDASGVKEKLGVLPENIDDYKALVGDSSDNYKGVPGVGPKTALKLLGEYGDLSGIYQNLKKIDVNLAKKLKEGKNSADMSYKLAQIVTDVNINFSLDATSKWNLNNPSLDKVFADLSFKTLAKRSKMLTIKMEKDMQESLF
jgi:DNA polymerase-1